MTRCFVVEYGIQGDPEDGGEGSGSEDIGDGAGRCRMVERVGAFGVVFDDSGLGSEVGRCEAASRAASHRPLCAQT